MVGNNRVNFAPDIVPEPPSIKKLVQQEDGKFVYVKEENPFQDIDGNSFKLRSQLKNGVHLKDCGVRHLEKTALSDKANAFGESVKAEVEKQKSAQQATE